MRLVSAHADELPKVAVLYLDIDGTVRKGKDQLGYFVNTADQVEVFAEVPELLRQYKELGYRIVGISNQGGIALGYMDEAVCADAMIETHRQCDEAFDYISWCSHHPDANDPEKAHCWCRKPMAGLVVETAIAMAHEFDEHYSVHQSLFVGDMITDAECAANAGIRFMNAAEWRRGKHLEEMFAV